jgi:hypothetical protein
MYKEYKKYLAHSAMLRVFWIVNFICSLIKEHSLIADYIAVRTPRPRKRGHFTSDLVSTFRETARP